MGVHVSLATQHMQFFSSIMGVSISFLSYLAFTILWPPVSGFQRPEKWAEPKDYIDPSDPSLLSGRANDEENTQSVVVKLAEKASL